MREHTRPRATYCDPDHARRFANGQARIRYRRSRDRALTLAAIIDAGYRRSRWRPAPLAPDPESLAAVIFGTAPAPVVRHGDTLDAVA
jgi:hypothetical protein